MLKRYDYGWLVIVFFLMAVLIHSGSALGKAAPDLSTAIIEVAHLSLEGG
jgi:hypothetical protein